MSKRKASRSIAMLLLFAAIAGIIIVMLIKFSESKDDSSYEMPSNAARVEFLNSCGLIVSPDPEKQEIRIPTKFGDIYEEYNRMQHEQGFHLKEYAGRDAVLISYRVLNCPDHAENVVANLLICDGKLIACDLTLNEENGITKPLITANEQPVK